MRGKSINLFLMDGIPTGRIKCTLANWTGIAYKIPRTYIEKCNDRMDLKQTGVYFLFGLSKETNGPIVYIGQARARKNGEGILNRLQEHKRNPQKGYWNEAVVFTTSNNSFGPTEISYLENRFCGLANKAGRYEVKNENDPSPGNITEEKESELEEFIDNAKVIIGTLGHQVFEPMPETTTTTDDNNVVVEDLLYLKRCTVDLGLTISVGRRTDNGFLLLAGSKMCSTQKTYNPAFFKNKTHKIRINNDGILEEDVLFNTSSGAACFVTGGSASGPESWKNKNGVSLKELELQDGQRDNDSDDNL